MDNDRSSHDHCVAKAPLPRRQRLCRARRQAGIGRIRLATERMPWVWLWSVTVDLPGGLPTGSAMDIDTAKSEFKAAWEALKARSAYKAMNIRGLGTMARPLH